MMRDSKKMMGFGLGLAFAAGFAMGCGDENPPDTFQTTLYQRLGQEAGIQTVIEDFVGRVVVDSAINGYFLNAGLNSGRLVTCLVKQVGSLTGGPQAYPGPGEGADADGCRNMQDSHRGMGVSQADFDDLAGHLVASLEEAGVMAADIDTIVQAVAPMAADIVEDPDNNGTVYQRVGRKPAIETVVDGFITAVVGDPEINGFFTTTDAVRLRTCLVRQVCSIDGPCVYGAGVEAELNGTPCRDMVSAHLNMRDDQGSVITIDDWNALVGHLVTELDTAGVSTEDTAALASVLAPMCADIVDGGTGCPEG